MSEPRRNESGTREPPRRVSSPGARPTASRRHRPTQRAARRPPAAGTSPRWGDLPWGGARAGRRSGGASAPCTVLSGATLVSRSGSSSCSARQPHAWPSARAAPSGSFPRQRSSTWPPPSWPASSTTGQPTRLAPCSPSTLRAGSLADSCRWLPLPRSRLSSQRPAGSSAGTGPLIGNLQASSGPTRDPQDASLPCETTRSTGGDQNMRNAANLTDSHGCPPAAHSGSKYVVVADLLRIQQQPGSNHDVRPASGGRECS